VDNQQEQIDAVAQASATSNPALAAQTYKTAKAFGIAWQDAEISPEVLAERDRYERQRNALLGYPSDFHKVTPDQQNQLTRRITGKGILTDWVLSDPSKHAALITPDDIEHMTGAAGLAAEAKHEWQQGMINLRTALLSMKDLRHQMEPDGLNAQEALSRQEANELAALKSLARVTQRQKDDAWSGRNAVATTAQSLPLMLPGIAEGAAGFFVGGPVGAGAGVYHGAFQVEAGLAFQEIIDSIKETQGREPTQEERTEAAKASFWAGQANGVMELIPMGMLAKNLPGARQLFRKKVKEKFMQRFGAAAAGYAGTMAAETGVEAMQELVTITARNSVDAAGEVSEEERNERVLSSAKGGLEMSAILGAPGCVFNTLFHADQAQKNAENLKNMTELAAKAPLAKALPEKLAEGLKAGGMTDDISIDAEVLVASLKQSGFTPEKIETAIPGLSKKIEDALETGGDVTFSAADAIAHFGAQDPTLKDVLARHGKLGGNLLSAEEARSPEFAKLMEEAIKGNQEAAKADAEQSSQADKVEAHWVAMADKVGQSGPGRAVAKVMRHLFTTASEITGESIDKLAGMIPVTADKAKFGTVSSSMIPRMPSLAR